MQARQDRQRSMCLTTSGVGGSVLLQHLLDQVDAPARAIELVAEQHIGRAGRGAEAAMHAGAQDLVGFGDIGIGQLREARIRSSCRGSPRHPAAVEDVLGIEAAGGRVRSSARKPARLADGTHRHCAGPARWPGSAWRGRPAASTRWRTSAACASGFGGSAAQISPPPQS